MANNLEPGGQLFRIDALTGCGSLVGFAEALVEYFSRRAPAPLSLISLDVNHFSHLNATRGHEAGDAALRWLGLALVEEANAPVYRIGGDEFAAILTEGDHSQHDEIGKRVYERLNRQAPQSGLKVPAASLALIHYTGDEGASPADVLVQLGDAIYAVKSKYQRTFKAFESGSFRLGENNFSLLWSANLLIERVVTLGLMLDESQRLAFTDPVTGLPNMRAAEQRLRTALAEAESSGQPLSVLLIDGDDLRQYNKISYAAGDEMIQNMGSTLHGQLRPDDFLARWRVGDEFLVILPGTHARQALLVGERLCQAVQNASQGWPLPVTVSIGVACFPDHGNTDIDLLRQAENANDQAKSEGKNRVVSAG